MCILTPVCSHQPLPCAHFEFISNTRRSWHFAKSASADLCHASAAVTMPPAALSGRHLKPSLFIFMCLFIRENLAGPQMTVDLLPRLRPPAATNVSIFATGINV
jgi:hypothetical protein